MNNNGWNQYIPPSSPPGFSYDQPAYINAVNPIQPYLPYPQYKNHDEEKRVKEAAALCTVAALGGVCIGVYLGKRMKHSSSTSCDIETDRSFNY